MSRPNILLLYTDQQRWDTIRALGNEHIYTPNLDRLVADGVACDNAFCNAPLCMPSRQSMLSGCYPSTVGCTTNGIEMPEQQATLATMLAPYGYRSGNLGKLHFKNHATRDHRIPHPRYGFDVAIISDEPGCYEDPYIAWVRDRAPEQVEACRCSTPPAWISEPVSKQERAVVTPYVFEGPEELTHSAFVADQTIAFISETRQQPFFAIAGFYAPHCPLNPPQRFLDWYDASALPAPVMSEEERANFGLDDDDWRHVKAYYYALISHVDDQIGRILAALEEWSLRENTLVVFVSDHGEHLGDHGWTNKGPPGHRSCSQVPLLLSLPGRIPAGVRIEDPVELVDLAPTLLDYAGIQVPPALQGRSLRSRIAGDAAPHRDSAYLEFQHPYGGLAWRSVRTLAHSYFRKHDGEELLYDLERDPDERQNLAGDPAAADALHAMRDLLISRSFDVAPRDRNKTGPY